MTKPYPDSPEYLARQAQGQKEIDFWENRSRLGDQFFLHEFADDKRKEAKGQADMVRSRLADDPDTEGYVRFYGTDEG